MIRVEDGIEVRVRPVKGPLPANLPKCLEETTWFVLAVPGYAQLIDQTSNGVRKFQIRQPRVVPSSTRLRPPLEPSHGATAKHLGEMFSRYLDHVLPKLDDTYHPTSVNILSVLRASAITIDSLALALAIAIESLVRREFAELGRPSPELRGVFDSAIEHVSNWAGEASIKRRITGQISTWKGSNAREALQSLAEHDIISHQQLKAWETVRHRMAHGKVVNRPVKELLLLCDLQHMALLRLLFKVLGYSGPYTDRSTEGWPDVQFGANSESRIALE
jgi:hypothetical protein